MSWFTDLAGKAESLLEKVDNTAANVLQVDEKTIPSDPQTENSDQPDSSLVLHPAEYGESRISRTTSEGSLLRLGPSAPVKSRLQSSVPRQQPKPLPKKEEKNDDQLFKFLNSNVSSSKEKKSSKQSPGLTRKTSEPEVPVKVEKKKPQDLLVAAKDGIEVTQAANVTDGDVDGVEEPPVQSMDHTSDSQLSPAVHKTDNNRASNMELENKLLKKEIASLNEEMVSQLQRVKEAEKGLQHAEQQLTKSQQQLMATESIVRQLRAAEEDFNQALAAKDSQLAVLRVRIQQVDQELQEKKSQIEKFKVEREQLLQDHTDSSGVHNHALEVVQAKLEETERKLKMEMEARHNVQQESMERQSRLEEEHHAMAESMKSLQKKVGEERYKVNDQASAFKIAKANLEAARQEMKDYKEKAGRILQAKDKVISTLREGRKGDDDLSGGVTSVEYDEVCQERVALKEELSQSRFKVESLKAEIQDMEHHHQTDEYIVQEKLDVLQGLLDDEKRKREACEEEIRTQMQDVRLAHEEGERNKASLMKQIQDREKEIQRLKNQLATKALTSVNEVELENRVRALTENLIQKQTVIEALSTEKNSLVLQLERLEQQYRDVQASSTKHINATTIPLNSTDDGDENTLSRVKSITSVMPTRLNESRQVKRAVNEIDKCSFRLGLFLKRYPIARLFVIVYMFLLHLWVLVVLLTYKPEIHDTSPAGMPQRPN